MINKSKYIKLAFGLYVLLHFVLAIIVFNFDEKTNVFSTSMKFRIDYFFHVLAFLPWAFWGYFLKINNLKWLIIGLCFALTVEGLHYFIPYRTYNNIDLLSNILGVLLGYLLLKIGLVFIRKNK